MGVEWDGEKKQQHSDEKDKSARFRCKPKKKTITIRRCLEDYSSVHAQRPRQSDDKCYRCRLGAANRIEYAFGVEATERRIDAMLAISSTQAVQPWMWICLKIDGAPD